MYFFRKKQKIFLLLADVTGLFISFYTANFIRFNHLEIDEKTFLLFSACVAASFIIMYIIGSYELKNITNRIKLISISFFGSLVMAITCISMSYLANIEKAGTFGRGVLIGTCGIFFIFLTFNRLISRNYIFQKSKNISWLFYGAQNHYDFFKKDLKNNSILSNKMSFINSQEMLPENFNVQLFNSLLILDLPILQPNSDNLKRLMSLKEKGLYTIDLISFYEQSWDKVPAFSLTEEWFLLSRGFSLFNSRQNLIKRASDIVLSLMLLTITWPIFIITAFLIKLTSKGSVFYRQVRTGKNNQNFTILKFRSMVTDAEKNGAVWATTADPRITAIGQIIRKTRIDELPQLFNVLKGDMSFIGPRPERPEFNTMLEAQIPFYQMRHAVAPGITGLAQVLYPYGASIDDSKEKLQYEIFYIKNYNFLIDIFILLKTVRIVLFGKGR